MPQPTRTQYIGRAMRSIPGWLHRADCLVLSAVNDLQVQCGIRGDLLEVGSYHGRSAVLMGYFLQPGERLYCCDLFEDQASAGGEGDARKYRTLTRQAFETNYLRFHAQLPEILQYTSTDLLRRGHVPPGLRLLHIDGSRKDDVITRDLANARALLAPGGVLVLDDQRQDKQTGVAQALWRAFDAGDFVPLAMATEKVYACAGADAPGFCDQLQTWAAGSGELHPEVQSAGGMRVLILYPLPRKDGQTRRLARKIVRS